MRLSSLDINLSSPNPPLFSLKLMAKRFSTLSLFLFCLLAFQEMTPSEAIVCSAPSTLFTGLCFSDGNCSAICEKENFLAGTCKRLRCVCQKDCGTASGGGGGGDQGQAPPEQGGGDQPSVATRKFLIHS